MNDTKQCVSCGLHKPFADFPKAASSNDGLYSYCRSCNAERSKKRQVTHPFDRAVRNAKARAKRSGVPFDIDEAYLEDIWTGVCPVFKTRLGLPHETANEDWLHRPSLDRIISHRGYTKGNVIWLSMRANTIKSDATHQQLYAVADWLHQTMKEIEQHEAR